MKREAMEKVRDKRDNQLLSEEETTAIWLDNKEMIRILCGLN
jgi:hypothetical protein